MPGDYSSMSLPALRAEAEYVGGCLYRAEDAFAQMLLTGRLKAVHRAIEAKRLENVRAAIYDEN